MDQVSTISYADGLRVCSPPDRSVRGWHWIL